MRSALDKLLSSKSSLRFLRYVVESRVPPDQLGQHCYRTACCRVQRRSQSSAAGLSVSFHNNEESSSKSHVLPEKRNDPSTFDLTESELWRAIQPTGGKTGSLYDWIRLVQFQQRRDGDAGVKKVWVAIRERKFKLRLDGDAVFLWETFLGCPSTVQDAIDLAIELKHQNPTSEYFRGAYLTAMRTLISMRAAGIRRRHRPILEAFPPEPDVIQKLEVIFRISPWLSEKLWQKFRLDLKNKGYYNDNLSPPKQTAKPHSSKSMSKTSHIHQELQSPEDDQSSYADQIRDRTTVASNEDLFIDPSSIKGVLGTEPFNRFLGNMSNIQPKTLDDAFIARLFATRGFSIGLIIRGLSMLSVETIGPLALREMTVRAQHVKQIEIKFSELREAGISIQTCVYCDSVKMFVRQNQTELLWNLLNSDLHPDEYEDQKKLRSLLADHLRHEDLVSAQRILSILTMKFNDQSRMQWNELFKFHLHNSSRSDFLHFTETMLGHGIGPASEVLNEFVDVFLPRRKRSHGPNVREGGPQDLVLVCNFNRRLLETGVAQISPLRWREIFRRLGMTGQLRRLHHLIIWLADHYSPWGYQHGIWKIKRNNRGIISLDPDIPVRTSYPELKLHKLPHSSPWWVPKKTPFLTSRERTPTIHVTQHMWQSSQESFESLFPGATQAALIEWSFKTMHRYIPILNTTTGPRLLPTSDARSKKLLPSSNTDHSHMFDNLARRIWNDTVRPPALKPLVATLRLLLALRTRGVPVHTSLVRSRIRLRLWILFGPSSGRVKANLTSTRRLVISLVEMVRIIQNVWPGGVFELDEGVLERLLTKRVPVSSQSSDQAYIDAVAFVFAVFGRSNKSGWRPAKKDVVSKWPTQRRTYLLGRRRIRTSQLVRFLSRGQYL